MRATKGENASSKRDVQEAVRKIPIQKGGRFLHVLDDLELILSEAKEGKRELPSLRQAAFESAERHGLSGNSTYGRLVLTAHRTEMGKEVAERAKSLRDEWIAEELKRGTYKGGKRSPIAKREKTLEDTSKFEASLWLKQRDWARNDLLRMFSSDSGGIAWFNLILNKEEKERIILWLDANTTAEERAQFHPRIAEIANIEYGMHWVGRRKGNTPSKREKQFQLHPDWEDEE